MIRPLVVAGMHRSGTSLVASVAAAAGVDMGERLLAPAPANPLGYFEDVTFLSLQQRMLTDCTPADDHGHRDWGWTEGERLDRERFPLYREEARALIEARRTGGPWGWKDPRTTLALDFWDDLLEDARYLFVYRYPWDVADSMQRLGAEVFLRNPEYGHRIWAFYNRHLLDFRRRHRERSLLVSVNALLRHPERFRTLLAERFGLHLPEERLREIVDDCMLRTVDGADPLVGLVAATSPESVRLLAELDAEADLSSSGLWEVPRAEERRALSIPGTEPVRLSIVIPCLDHGDFLVEAVASAERSIAEPYELIVVNDGSRQPRTLVVLAALEAAGYCVVHQENRGLAAARNRGIELATGRYVLPLDSDNRLLPGFPEAAARVLDEDPGVGVVYGDRSELGLRSGVVQVPEFDLDMLLTGNFIDACTVIRKQTWSECAGFDGAMPNQGWEDWDLWISAAERGWRFHHLPGAAFEYKVRPESMSWRLTGPEVGRPLQGYIVEKHRDLYLQRLPHLLIMVQAARREVEALATERDIASRAASQLAEAVREREAMAAERDGLAAEHGRLLMDRARLEAERDRLYQELASWQERVAGMEGTSAWRLRGRLVRLKQAWRSQRQKPVRPNILFVMADQMRLDALGVINGWTRTPNLDRLARGGHLFRGGVTTNSAECVPARFSLALGLYPHQTGVWQNGVYTLNPECPNWMQAVERAGYCTSLFGKTHLHPHEGDLRDRVHLMHAYGLQVVDETAGPHMSAHVLSNMTHAWQEQGLWERYREDVVDRVRSKRHLVRPSVLGTEHHYDVYVGRQAASYLARLDDPRPWFCWVSFGGPHEPWDAPEPYASLYAQADIPSPIPRLRGHERVGGLLRRAFDSDHYSPPLPPEEVRAMRANYAGNVTLIDEQIGNILEVVRSRGELERTLIVFTSDHGEMNGDQGLLYKANFLDPVIQVPLIIRPPHRGTVGEGRELSVLAEWMDVGATIVDYAGGSLPGLSHARSLRPLIEGEAATQREFAVSEFLGHTAIVDHQWKIEFGPDDRPVLLLDRASDPLEQVNLVEDSRYAGTMAELRERLTAFRAATPAPPVKATYAD